MDETLSGVQLRRTVLELNPQELLERERAQQELRRTVLELNLRMKAEG